MGQGSMGNVHRASPRAPVLLLWRPRSPVEVPRRPLSIDKIAAILQAEIASRSRNAGEYERRGNATQAAELRYEIATIQPLTALRSQP